MRELVRLIDTYDNSKNIYIVEKDSFDMDEFKKVYNSARNEWYDKEGKDLDCLLGHIVAKLEKHGYHLYPLTIDTELDF